MRYIAWAVIGLIGIGAYMALTEKPKVDLAQVLSRSAVAMERFNAYLAKEQVASVTDAHLDQLNEYLERVMNAPPKFHDEQIAMQLGKDAKFTGYADADKNGNISENEEKLFTIELDAERKRFIATDSSGTATSRSFSGSGFLTGMLIGSMLSRQRSAGITPAHFASRKVTSPTTYRRARSRARSGGLRAGK